MNLESSEIFRDASETWGMGCNSNVCSSNNNTHGNVPINGIHGQFVLIGYVPEELDMSSVGVMKRELFSTQMFDLVLNTTGNLVYYNTT